MPKRLAMVLTVLFTLGVGNAWAETVFSDEFDNVGTGSNTSISNRNGWSGFSNCYAQYNSGLRLGSSKNTGSITKTAMTNIEGSTTLTVTFYLAKYNSDSGKMNIIVSGGGTASTTTFTPAGNAGVTSTTSKATWTDEYKCTFTIENATSATTIKFATSSNRLILGPVTISTPDEPETPEKTATSLKWSAASYTATIGGTNTFPTLTTTPGNLTGVTYSSSNTDAATINASTGEITLVAAGTTTITASYAGNETYEAAENATYTLTVESAQGGGSGSGECTWELVTDASTLKVDDEVIITSGGTDATNDKYALSTNQKSSNRGAAEVTKKGNTLTDPSADVQVLTLKAGSTTGTWAFYTGSSGYLYAASSSGNQLKTKTTLDVHGSWTITIENEIASIVATGSSNRNVMQYNYNNGSPLFNCYASASQTALAIYKKVCTGGATETTYSVTAGTVQNGSIKFSKTGEGEFTDTQLTGLEEGDYAHFVVNPTLGYTLSGAPSVKDASDNNVECVDMDGIWMFEMPASNVTVSASCTLKEYKITIDDAIENGTASATPSVAVMGTSITLTPTPATGYQFKSWNVTKKGGETITVPNNQFTMPASDVTVSAEFTPIIYTITYKNDDHINYTSETPETITIKDTGFELEYSVEDGYELTGVTVTMGGEELVLEEEYLWDKTYMLILPEIDVIGNIVVTFETVATCTQLPTISAATSSDITQTTAMLSCSGISSLGSAGCSITSYGFVWGTTTNPTTSNNKVQVGTTYTTTGTNFSNKLTGLTANTTYYVRPYATNGNGTAYGTEISFKTLDLVKLTTPTNLSVSNISCSNATLAWSAVAGASKYELRLTNTSTSNTTTSYPTTNSAYLTLASGTTYSWTVQAIGDGITYNNSDITEGEDFTSHYTITYDENGGSTVGDDCGTTLPSELPTTTKSHYTFIGWYMDKELNTPAEAGSVINTNTILYAKWEEIKFTITWSINGNTTNSQELQEGTTITPPAVDDAATYACEDKVFVGWVDASIVGSTNEEPNFITDFGNVKENKIYYAVFATASGDGFTLGQSGDFTIYANVEGTNYYATGNIGDNSKNGKISSTTTESDANRYTFTAISASNEAFTYTIKKGTTYIAYSKNAQNNSTDFKNQDESYTWTISKGTKGSWRVASETVGRAFVFRAGPGYNLFGGYATQNITDNQTIYYDIEIGGATTYTEYVTSCVTCENVLTISKGNEENGTFTLDKVGEQETCDGLSVLVTPTPAEHYHVASVTASTGETAVNNGDGTYTITYAANSTGESTINVVFEEDTKYTVTWMVNGVPYTSTTVYADERVATLPTPPEPNAYCGDVFVGWTTENPASGNFNEAPTVYNEQLAFPPATGNQTFYAVFADYKN